MSLGSAMAIMRTAAARGTRAAELEALIHRARARARNETLGDGIEDEQEDDN
jgi:hypothetical protein